VSDRVLGRTSSVFSRNFLNFFVVTAIASLPMKGLIDAPDNLVLALPLVGFSLFLAIALNTLSQGHRAVRRVSGHARPSGRSGRVGAGRLASIFSHHRPRGPGRSRNPWARPVCGTRSDLVTMWFVATPACVVEGLGVSRSMERSAQLTRGHRWKIFGMIALLIMTDSIVDKWIDQFWARRQAASLLSPAMSSGADLGRVLLPSSRWSPITTCGCQEGCRYRTDRGRVSNEILCGSRRCPSMLGRCQPRTTRLVLSQTIGIA